MARYAQQINLQIPLLSKKLRDSVKQFCRFRQFATLREAFGLGRGNLVEWVMTGEDPVINTSARYPGTLVNLQSGDGINLITNKLEVKELGYSVAYNKYDIEQSEINYVDITRKYLAREVASLIDHNIERELNLTPYRYIPYSDTKGMNIGINDWASVGPSGLPNDMGVAANFGKLVPTFRQSYGFRGTRGPGVYGNVAAVPTLLVMSRAPVVAGQAIDYAVASLDTTDLLPSKGVNPAVDLTTVTPRMTYEHLQNMIAYAQELGIYGFDKLNGDYVLIGPPSQILNLIASLGGARTGNAPIHNSSFGNFESAMKLYGEDRRIDLGCGVRLVVDTFATMHEDNWYNYYKVPVAVPIQPVDTSQIVPTTFDCVYHCPPPGAAGSGGVLNAPARPAPAFAPIRNLIGTDGANTTWLANTVAAGTVPWDAWNFIDRINAVPPHPQQLRRMLPASITSRNNLGPCYLLADDPVREVIAVPENIKTNEPSNYGRLTGLAWHMLGGWRNTTVVPDGGWSTNLDDLVGNVNGIFAAAGRNYTALKKTRAIKFDFPMFFTT